MNNTNRKEENMQKWEYLVLVRKVTKWDFEWHDKKYKNMGAEEVLNELGQMGWELITMTPWKWGGDASDLSIHYILKRPC